MAGRSLRDRYVTLYGRKPVLEALEAPDVDVAKVFLVAGSGGAAVEAIVAAAAKRGVEVERVRVEFVTSLTRNGRQHQGVAADVTAPELSGLDTFLERRRGRHHATSVLVLDGVTNPANLGLALRSAAAAGLHGVVVPRRNTAELGPLAVKASAGVALRAPIVRCDTAAEAVAALAEARFHVVGLDARPGATSLFEAALPERAAYVLGNESTGLSDEVAHHVAEWVCIPLERGVESLNVACAATLVAYEIARRGLSARTS